MKQQKLKRFFIIMISLFAISGCGKKDYQPVAVKEKTDKCEICHMAVKNNQFPVELILENGKSMVFDDIGCMYKWIKENKDKKISNSYVKDYYSKEWIDLEKATFVYDKAIKTPMAYNVISFSDKKAAQKFVAAHGGRLLSYEKLQQHSWERNEEMVKKMKKMKMDGGKDKMQMEGSKRHQ